ncbi:MAG: hypothetical protein AAF291_02990 [Pseudomonadota bacterium]
MSVIAILMFTTLTIALGVGIWQASKMEKILPDDTSHLKPERSLQRKDRVEATSALEDKDVRGTKKAPLKA